MVRSIETATLLLSFSFELSTIIPSLVQSLIKRGRVYLTAARLESGAQNGAVGKGTVRSVAEEPSSDCRYADSIVGEGKEGFGESVLE